MHHAHRQALGFLITALAVAAVGARQSTTADAVMGEALHQEEVAGDLEKAIAGFKRVIADPSAGRPMVAKALLHLGRSQERLGQTNAKAAYERIAREYADQPEIIAQARARLAALGTRSDDESGVVTRQVWAGEGIDPYGSPSPDGRLFAFTDWTLSYGNLAVRDLSTGKTRVLTSGGNALYPVISPDGQRIAYSWESQSMSIRVVDVDGTGSRVLLEKPGLMSGSYLRWSPDGRQVAALISLPPEDASTFIAITVATGQVVTLKKFGPDKWGELAGYSPDGRYLLYSGEGPAPEDKGIFVMSADGKRETRIAQSVGTDTSPAWTPDGRGVVFVSNRSGTQDLWLVRIAEGTATGEPELLRNNVGDAWAMGFRSDGLYYYGLFNRQVDAYTCQIDPESLRVVTPPSRLTDRFIGTNSGPSFSPDGHRVVFFRGGDRRSMSLVVRSVADGQERTLPAKFTDTILAGRMGPTWTADGKSVIVPEQEYPTYRFRAVDADTGAMRTLVEDPNVWGQARISPDGLYLFYTGVENPYRAGTHVLRLIRRELSTGRELELFRVNSDGVGFFGLAVSPDGREIALMANEGDGRTLMAVPTAGGPRRILYRGTYSKPAPHGAAWTPDGKYILTMSLPTPRTSTMLAFPAAGGEPKTLDISMQELLAPSISADGRHLVFTGARARGEVWTIKNLLPRQSTERQASK